MSMLANTTPNIGGAIAGAFIGLLLVMAIGIGVAILIIRALIKYAARCNADAFHYSALAKLIAKELRESNQQELQSKDISGKDEENK